jgi:hypothetical protein
MLKGLSITLMVIFGIILVVSLVSFTFAHSGSKVLEKETLKQGFVDFVEKQLIKEHSLADIQAGETEILNQCGNNSFINLDFSGENVSVSCDELRSTNVTYAVGNAFFEELYNKENNCSWEVWHCIENSDGKFLISHRFSDYVNKMVIFSLVIAIISIIILFLVKTSLKSFFVETGLCFIISALISWVPVHVLIQNLKLQFVILNKFYSNLLVVVISLAVIGIILFVMQFFIKGKKTVKKK